MARLLTPQASLYSRAQIDQMVAPIALYPDALMTQVFMAAAYPYDVADADQWLQTNRGLSGRYLDDALATASWDPSVIALCKFPPPWTGWEGISSGPPIWATPS